ncbi:hypothetical protein MKW94_009761 [Papaver nudicaule]|uniref:Protein TAPETUM DETERMINANT 1 n=1 Tax=Papaver nudicaule TaxID=74823 RepID=A0AA42AYL2_PAPNU|nr:hypothetical protein [Papaver nudicaule]
MGAFNMQLNPSNNYNLMKILIIVILVFCNISGLAHSSTGSETKMVQPSSSSHQALNDSILLLHSRNRKLLSNEHCTSKDISISQSKDSSSTGIPQYIVQIVNTCMSSACVPKHIHVHCGWFASAKIVNPNIFKRLSHDDCLVNNGRPLLNSQVVRFTYSNSFMYPISFMSAKFCF